MRAACFRGPGRVEVEEVPEPQIGASDEVIVDVSSAGLCGSDLHPYHGREACGPGVIPGHEAVGVVTEVGRAVSRFRPGDRVIVPFTSSCGACRPCLEGLSARCDFGRLFGWADPDDPELRLHGAQAERMLVPMADSTLVGAPDVDDSTAVLLADNLPTASAALDRVRLSGTLAVVGLGSVGLCVAAVALACGVEEVVGWDIVESRRHSAKRLGAALVDPADGFDAPVVVEAAGSADAQRACLRMARPGATISLISVQTDNRFAITPVEAYDRNLTITAGRAPVRSVLARDIGLLTDVGRACSEVIVDAGGTPLSAAAATYERFASHQFVKATFDPAA